MAKVPAKTIFFTAIMTAWLAAAIIFAGVFVIEKHIHDHTGAHCRICLEIQIALRIIEAFGRLGVCLFFAGFIKHAVSLKKLQPFFFVKKYTELKVRFNC